MYSRCMASPIPAKAADIVAEISGQHRHKQADEHHHEGRLRDLQAAGDDVACRSTTLSWQPETARR